MNSGDDVPSSRVSGEDFDLLVGIIREEIGVHAAMGVLEDEEYAVSGPLDVVAHAITVAFELRRR